MHHSESPRLRGPGTEPFHEEFHRHPHLRDPVARLQVQQADARLGGDVVLVDGDDLAERVKAATGGAAIKLGIDAVGDKATMRMAASLAEGATIVNYGALSGEPCVVSPRELVFRDVSLKGFWLARWFRTTPQPKQYALLTELAGLIAVGKLSTPIQATYDVAQIKEAVTAAAAGERQGKILIVPSHA